MLMSMANTWNIMKTINIHLTLYRSSIIEQLRGPVEKGRKWRFEVKIEIAPI